MTDATGHKEKMQERQAKQRAKVAELQDPEKGLVLVHTGAGKGKSSSAFVVLTFEFVSIFHKSLYPSQQECQSHFTELLEV